MKRSLTPLFLVILVLAVANTTLVAAGVVPIYSGFPPLKESAAYQQYRSRPVSELSKLIYLIDRFADTDIQILHDSHYFDAKFAGHVARWFLSRHYRGETTSQWILRWCNASVPAGNLIWVKLPAGQFKLAREILLGELRDLETLAAETPAAAVKMPK